MSSEGHNLTLGMKLKKCHVPPTVTVALKQAQGDSNLNWSHSLKDGDKIEVPTSGESFSGGLPVTESAIYVQVGLQKINGSHINYTVRRHSTTLRTVYILKILPDVFLLTRCVLFHKFCAMIFKDNSVFFL